jgi:hypothetical protein
MFFLCKSSKDCEDKDVCDRKSHECRAPLRKPAANKAALAKECLSKNIPITYERGEKKGERKSREALARCRTQPSRITVRGDRILFLPAPAPKISLSVAAASSSPFVRPKEAELRTMNKPELATLFRKGQRHGFIAPTKQADDLTKKQLATAITNARRKL